MFAERPILKGDQFSLMKNYWQVEIITLISKKRPKVRTAGFIEIQNWGSHFENIGKKIERADGPNNG